MNLPLNGEHMAENLAAVVTVACELGLDFDVVPEGLHGFCPAPQRFVVRRKGTWKIVDDTYNANPLSMHHAVLQAAELAGKRDLIFVLGDMLELGDATVAEHERLGRLVASTGFATCTISGSRRSHSGVDSGMPEKSATPCPARAAFPECLGSFPAKGE
jgi:UDP-N-acetylmuramoyl-tripeptide--D-alanyl-D-alanine ligase